jgi:hypothetical protein
VSQSGGDMSMISVSSSAIAAIGFEGGTLGVRFHSSSTVYLFYRVPYELFERFLNAGSKGGFYAHYIRGRYR